MRNKRSRRSRRLGTPSPEREVSETRVGSSETGNITLTNSNLNVQESLGEPNFENQLREPSQISDEIQVWTQTVEQKNTERIEKMREEMDSKLEAILKEIKYNITVHRQAILLLVVESGTRKFRCLSVECLFVESGTYDVICQFCTVKGMVVESEILKAQTAL